MVVFGLIVVGGPYIYSKNFTQEWSFNPGNSRIFSNLQTGRLQLLSFGYSKQKIKDSLNITWAKMVLQNVDPKGGLVWFKGGAPSLFSPTSQ